MLKKLRFGLVIVCFVLSFTFLLHVTREPVVTLHILLTLLTVTHHCMGGSRDHLSALVYSDQSQPSASKFQASPSNFSGINAKLCVSVKIWVDIKII